MELGESPLWVSRVPTRPVDDSEPPGSAERERAKPAAIRHRPTPISRVPTPRRGRECGRGPDARAAGLDRSTISLGSPHFEQTWQAGSPGNLLTTSEAAKTARLPVTEARLSAVKSTRRKPPAN
jgi:hypothetical protein